jgi:meso-butanediol dehydrogenase / (S,S)-butanediol dehydrogenase / diacetyl reductase
MADTLQGRVALVTGGGRGIGRSVALAFAREGAAVAVVARTATEVESVAAECRALGGRALAVIADCSVEADIGRAMTAVASGLGPVDILVNNAGANVLGRIGEMDPAAWWQQLEINLRGPYLCSRAAIPGMVERKWGRVINVSSVAGKVGMQFATAYCAAKHGLIGFTRALALEVADRGVTVNAICPGWVETALTESTFAQRSLLFGRPVESIRQAMLWSIPQKAAMKPDDIAPTVVFLASDGAARITGESMNVSAGLVMH